MSTRPDIKQAVPPSEPPEDQLPRNPRTVPAKRNGLPETLRYDYHGPKPLPGGVPVEDSGEDGSLSTLAAETHALAYRCPSCGTTATVGKTVGPAHKPHCAVADHIARLRAGRAAS